MVEWVRSGLSGEPDGPLTEDEARAVELITLARKWSKTLARGLERHNRRLLDAEKLSGVDGRWMQRCESTMRGLPPRGMTNAVIRAR